MRILGLDRIGSISGLIIFFMGVGLMLFTFYTGYTFIMNPDSLTGFAKLVPPSKVEVSAGGMPIPGLEELIGATRMFAYLIPTSLILAMGYVASKISAAGIQMYRKISNEP
jgi:hypothetical protein